MENLSKEENEMTERPPLWQSIGATIAVIAVLAEILHMVFTRL